MRFGLKIRTATTPEGVQPPPRRPSSAVVSTDEAVGVPGVFRALQVLTTAGDQVGVDVERAGQIIPAPSIILKPWLSRSRRAWIDLFILSLATDGNAFIHKRSANGAVVDLPILPPALVHVDEDEHKRPYYVYDGKRYTSDEIIHVRFLEVPGRLRGIGPIQAARAGLTFSRDLREHISRWFDDSGEDSGYLISDQALTGEDAKRYRRAWNGLDPETGARLDNTDNPKRVKVLGKGLRYERNLLRPEDALWLQAQNWTLRESAIVFGIPSTLMLVGYDGASKTYENSNAEWLAFVRFTLMGYLGKIEDALSEVLVRGQSARFRIEDLLRPDTKARYETYNLAIDGGWMTPAEVRRFERLPDHPAILDEPRPASSIKPAPAPATQKDPANA